MADAPPWWWALLGGAIGKLTGNLQEHGCVGRMFETGNGAIIQNPVESCSRLPCRLGNPPFLRSEIPSGRDQSDRSITHVFVHDGVVVEIDPDRVVAVPGHVVLFRVLPPLLEGAVMVGAEDLIVEPQTEARPAESVGPDLGVLAMAADLLVVPLAGEMRGDA